MQIRHFLLTIVLTGCAAVPAASLSTPVATAPPSSNSGALPAATAPAPTSVPATPPTSTRPAVFSGTVETLTPEQLPDSWREGCPLSTDQLRLLRISHLGYDGEVHQGELVINAEHADAVLGVFATLFDAGFPIERMDPVDVFDGNDDRSMAANNTSGFNCREVADRPGVWSQHAFGNAIDLNPLTNPYLRADGQVLPPQGETFIDRNVPNPGLITTGSAPVEAFASIGWEWGGNWTNPDYQHFSANGN